MTTTPHSNPGAAFGGSFLWQAPGRILTPEDFTEEHRAIAKATEEFFAKEVAPHLEAIQKQDFPTLLRALRKSAEMGLVASLVPEAYGGMEMDLTSAMIISEGVARDASYAMCHGAQAGIGALPVLYFGTEEQKARYLPGLVSAELIAAYCLSEPQAGSDAMNVRTRAELSADGSHYVLNGQKMWITNGAIADLYTVFAKVDGTQFTAFLVERGWTGVKAGEEEKKKMGLKGSSTTALYFDNVRVPVENVLGEVGQGHKIAFNILNLGRLKLAMYAHGECREALAHSLRYARERVAFGQPIGQFGLIQHKLAEMAARMYANESMAYRVTGHIQARGGDLLKATEEFAVECSLVKVLGSETLGFVTDEAVQIHGGYGYHQDYAVERLYRDARIYRIFEGTNEINRLLAPQMLHKRAKAGRIALPDAAREPRTPREVALMLLHSSGSEQETLAAATDAMMYALAMESAEIRAAQSGSEMARDLAAVFGEFAITQIEAAVRTVYGVLGRTPITLERPAANLVTVRRRIAERLLDAGKYVV